MRIELPSRAMSIETAKAAGIKTISIEDEIITLTITQQIKTILKQTPDGYHFVTIQIGQQWRDVYVKLPRRRAG
jgi:hypothetical protein